MPRARWSLPLNSLIVDMPLKRVWTRGGLSEEADASVTPDTESRALTIDVAQRDGSHPLLKVVWLTHSPGHLVSCASAQSRPEAQNSSSSICKSWTIRRFQESSTSKVR